MKRSLTYPLLSMQTEIKKTNVPLIALMSLHFYLALQLFPVTWEHVLSDKTDHPASRGSITFHEYFLVYLMGFSKSVMEISDTHSAELSPNLFLLRCYSSLNLYHHLPLLTFSLTSPQIHRQSLLALSWIWPLLPFYCFNSSPTDPFSLC